jgi:hypothetical protein
MIDRSIGIASSGWPCDEGRAAKAIKTNEVIALICTSSLLHVPFCESPASRYPLAVEAVQATWQNNATVNAGASMMDRANQLIMRASGQTREPEFVNSSGAVRILVSALERLGYSTNRC